VKKQSRWNKLWNKLKEKRLSNRTTRVRRRGPSGNMAGAKLLKSVGMVQDMYNPGQWTKSEKGGTLTMCNPGGSVSEVFRDIGRARNKLKKLKKR